MKTDHSFVYDRTLRELFQEVPVKLVELLVGEKVDEVLESTFPKVEERRVDLLTRLSGGQLFHLEIQSVQDTKMPLRMLKYAWLIYEHYGVFPLQTVLYIGARKIKIPDKIVTTNLCYTYNVKDIREFDCSALIESENLSDNIIAILCNIKDIDSFYQKLMQKLSKIEGKKREDYLRKLFYLLRLRPDIAVVLKEKEKEQKMPFILDKEIDPLYHEGLEKGLEKGKKEATLQTKLEIAKSMLAQNLSLEMIVTVTGLSEKTVRELAVKKS